MTAFRSINPSVVRFRVRNHPFEKRANRGTKERDESLILALSLHPCLLRVFSSPRKSLLRRVPRFRSSVSLSYDCYYSENRYLFPRSRNIIYKKGSMNFSRWIYIARKKGCWGAWIDGFSDPEVGIERSWDGRRAEGRRISGSGPSASPLETHAVNNEPRLSFAPFARDTKTMGKELLPIYFEKREKDTMVDLNRAAEGSS